MNTAKARERFLTHELIEAHKNVDRDIEIFQLGSAYARYEDYCERYAFCDDEKDGETLTLLESNAFIAIRRALLAGIDPESDTYLGVKLRNLIDHYDEWLLIIENHEKETRIAFDDEEKSK